MNKSSTIALAVGIGLAVAAVKVGQSALADTRWTKNAAMFQVGPEGAYTSSGQPLPSKWICSRGAAKHLRCVLDVTVPDSVSETGNVSTEAVNGTDTDAGT